jgi:hypothetical protein
LPICEPELDVQLKRALIRRLSAGALAKAGATEISGRALFESLETAVPFTERRGHAIDQGRDRRTLRDIDPGARCEISHRVDEPLRLRLARGCDEHQRARHEAQTTQWHRNPCSNREILLST